MYLQMLRSKLHGATVTDSQLEYEGSLTIDRSLMDAVKLNPFEKILVANMANGERFETYAIPGDSGSGAICLNGATAHKGGIGDRLIIFTFCMVTEEDVAAHRPMVLRLTPENKPEGHLRQETPADAAFVHGSPQSRPPGILLSRG